MANHRGPGRMTGLSLSLALLLISACSDDDPVTPPPGNSGAYDLTFTGTIAPHANQMLRVLVIMEDNGAIVANETLTVPANGSFSLAWTDVLTAGKAHRIDFYADHNGNGTYDAPPTDHAWRIALGQADGHVTRDFQHDTNFTDVGDSFDFRLTFTASLAPHAGQTLNLAVVKVGSGGDETIATDQTMVAADGSVSFNWTNLLEDGHDYTLDFYADHNGNGTCDGPPTDHAWRLDLGLIRGDVTRDFQHDTNFTDVCGSF